MILRLMSIERACGQLWQLLYVDHGVPRANLAITADEERRFNVLRMIPFDRLHQARHLSGDKGGALSLRNRQRSTVGAMNGDDRNANLVQSRDAGNPADSDLRHQRANSIQGHLRIDKTLSARTKLLAGRLSFQSTRGRVGYYFRLVRLTRMQ